MLETVYRRLLIPAFESVVKGRRTFAYWCQLEESQWLPAEELRTRQVASLRRLLEHAAVNCPYYSDAWHTLGLDPRQLSSIEDFQEWPLIDRETIHAHRAAMRTVRPPLRLIRKATGGSSGVPLEFDLDEDSNDRRMAAWHRGYSWAGASPGTRQWYLWGGATAPVSLRRCVKDALYNRLYRRHMTSSFGMSDDSIPWYFDQLNPAEPHSIVAYTNPLYALARGFEDRGLRPWSPRSIVVGAEKLHDFQRTLIERVFHAPVFETYGSREFMLIGGECDEHSGLHLTMENLLVEIVADDGRPTPAGEEGNVVITDLTNCGMPFIRYQNGDRAISGFHQCRCGRGLPLLKKVVGRRLDMLETPDGRSVPGEFFPHLVKEFPSIRRFQVVQHDRRKIELRLVVNREWNESNRQSLERQVRAVVGPVVHLVVAIVDDIPLTRAGKLQVVVRHHPPTPHPNRRP